MHAELPTRDRTRTLIAGGFALVFILMLAGTATAMRTMTRANDTLAALIHDNNEKTALAYQARDAVRVRSNTMQALLQSDDPAQRDRMIDRIRNYSSSYVESRDALDALEANDKEATVLERIAQAEQRTIENYAQALELLYNMRHLPDSLKAQFGNLQLQELTLLNHLNELVKLQDELGVERLAASNSDYENTLRTLSWALIATFILSLIISLIVIHRVSENNRRVHHMANHDDLTGLHNRRAFEEHLAHVMQLAANGVSNYGLLYLDLDRFKIVNDTCGHHAGDLLLQEITALVSERLRRSDLFARVGGDEFAIIAEIEHADALAALAEDLRQRTHDYTFNYEGESFKVSFSIGAVQISADVQDLETLIQDVDSACYVAKQGGRNRVHLAQENDTEVVRYRNDIAGLQALQQTLENQGMALYYQPVFDIGSATPQLAHCEILLRFIGADGRVLSPATLIPIAEKYNLMTEIDRWVVSRVIAWLEQHQYNPAVPRLLVNLSGGSFIDDEFIDFLFATLHESQVEPSRIAFEITETAAVDNLEKAARVIERIRTLGCHFALDDFGTGFSTFEYLKKLPIDYLKIDGSLVRNMALDRIDEEMVRAINQIGHATGAKTIAEFVESEATLSMLRQIGVDYAQGFGLARPAPLQHLLDSHEPDAAAEAPRKAS